MGFVLSVAHIPPLPMVYGRPSYIVGCAGRNDRMTEVLLISPRRDHCRLGCDNVPSGYPRWGHNHGPVLCVGDVFKSHISSSFFRVGATILSNGQAEVYTEC